MAETTLLERIRTRYPGAPEIGTPEIAATQTGEQPPLLDRIRQRVPITAPTATPTATAGGSLLDRIRTRTGAQEVAPATEATAIPTMGEAWANPNRSLVGRLWDVANTPLSNELGWDADRLSRWMGSEFNYTPGGFTKGAAGIATSFTSPLSLLLLFGGPLGRAVGLFKPGGYRLLAQSVEKGGAALTDVELQSVTKAAKIMEAASKRGLSAAEGLAAVRRAGVDPDLVVKSTKVLQESGLNTDSLIRNGFIRRFGSTMLNRALGVGPANAERAATIAQAAFDIGFTADQFYHMAIASPRFLDAMKVYSDAKERGDDATAQKALDEIKEFGLIAVVGGGLGLLGAKQSLHEAGVGMDTAKAMFGLQVKPSEEVKSVRRIFGEYDRKKLEQGRVQELWAHDIRNWTEEFQKRHPDIDVAKAKGLFKSPLDMMRVFNLIEAGNDLGVMGKRKEILQRAIQGGDAGTVMGEVPNWELAHMGSMDVADWAPQVIKTVETSGGATWNPRYGRMTEGFVGEVYPEGRKSLDHPPTAEDIVQFYDANRELFERYPELSIGVFGNNLEISAASDNPEAAMNVFKQLDQQSIADLKKIPESGEAPDSAFLQIGGSGKTTAFPNYPLEQRLADLHEPTQTFLPDGNLGVLKLAHTYSREKGKPAAAPRVVEVDPRASKIADAYDAMRHDPNDPAVKKSYDALIKEVKEQYDLLLKNGYKIEFLDPSVKEQPYKDWPDVLKDIRENKNLKVWTGGELPADHPLSRIDPETGQSYNNIFRAVHDFFGHSAEGHDFKQMGEENAWLAHSRMFSDEAIPALTTETKGQNSWFWENRGVRRADGSVPRPGDPEFVPLEARAYPEQKAGLLPEEFWVRDDPEEFAFRKTFPEFDSIEKRYGRTTNPRKAGLIGPDGRMITLGARTHFDMIGERPLSGEVDPRIDYINQTGVIRSRFRTGKAGEEFVFTLPEYGVTPDQALRIQEAADTIPNGRVVLESASSRPKSIAIDFPKRQEVADQLVRLSEESREFAYRPRPSDLTPMERKNLVQRPKVDDVATFVKVSSELPAVKELADVARVGEIGKLWYDRSIESFKALRELAPKYFRPEDADVWAGVVAATSPQQSPALNLREALTFWHQWVDNDRPQTEKEILALQRSKKIDRLVNQPSKIGNLVAAIQGREMLRDDKTKYFKVGNFAKNLSGNFQHAVHDSWMGVLFGRQENEVAMAPIYHAMSLQTRLVAQELGWEPAQAQAAMWVFTKTLADLSGWQGAAGNYIKPAEAVKFLTPEKMATIASDFADIMRTDKEVRGTLYELGVNLNELDKRLDSLPSKPWKSVPEGVSPENIARAAERIGAAQRKLSGFTEYSETGAVSDAFEFPGAGDASFDPAELAYRLPKLPSGEEINSRMKKVWKKAVTDNPRNRRISLILSDGTYITDQTGSHPLMFEAAFPVEIPKRWSDMDVEDALHEYRDMAMRKSGIIRISENEPDQLSVHLESPPTPKQMKAIAESARGRSVFWDVGYGDNGESGSGSFGDFQRTVERHWGGELASLGFVSRAVQIADTKLPAKGTGDQFLATLRNNGVKEDEIKWTGLDDFLSGKKSVSKQEVQEFLRENEVRVEEVRKGGVQKSPAGRLEHLPNGKYRVDYPGLQTSLFDTRAEARAELERLQIQFGKPDTKFAQWQVPGGTNYREVLLTLPDERVPRSEEQRIALSNALRNFGVDSPQYQKLLTQVGDTQKRTFVGGHWAEPNVLAHVRLNDRVDADGKRVLFVEEVQSDWHQKGRREGYQPGKTEVEAANQARRDYQAYRAELEKKYDTPFIGKEGLATPEEIQKLRDLVTKLKPLNFDKRSSLPPDAPFKKDWHELAMKRVLRMAAEEGYDRVAWTPGKVQAERYDLSKHVSEVLYEPETKSLYAKGIDGGTVIERDDVTPDQLANYVGKDVAQKLMERNSEKVPNFGGQYKVLRGLDLRVGGEGMKGFYDKMIPDFLNRYGKKWGAKVGTTDIPLVLGMKTSMGNERLQWNAESVPTAGFINRLLKENRNKPLREQMSVTETGQLTNIVIAMEDQNMTFKEAFEQHGSINAARALGGDAEWVPKKKSEGVYSIDITPEMKKSVMEGQPLFAKGWDQVGDVVPDMFREPEAWADTTSKMNFRYEPRTEDIPGRIKTDFRTQKLLESVTATKGWIGLTVKPENVKSMTDALSLIEEHARVFNPKAAEKIQSLREAFGEATRENPYGVAIVPSFGRVQSHELLHVMQLESGKGDINKHADWLTLSQSPEMTIFKPILARIGYNPEQPRVLAVEAATHIMAGDSVLGTPAQRASFIDKYFESVLKQSGAKTLDRMEKIVTDEVKPVLQALKTRLSQQEKVNAELGKLEREGFRTLRRELSEAGESVVGREGLAARGEAEGAGKSYRRNEADVRVRKLFGTKPSARSVKQNGTFLLSDGLFTGAGIDDSHPEVAAKVLGIKKYEDDFDVVAEFMNKTGAIRVGYTEASYGDYSAVAEVYSKPTREQIRSLAALAKRFDGIDYEIHTADGKVITGVNGTIGELQRSVEEAYTNSRQELPSLVRKPDEESFIKPDNFLNKAEVDIDTITESSKKRVIQYREQLRSGKDLEPVEMVVDAEGNLIGHDGVLRAVAAKQEGQKEIPVRIHKLGTPEEEIQYLESRSTPPPINPERASQAMDDNRIEDLIRSGKLRNSKNYNPEQRQELVDSYDPAAITPEHVAIAKEIMGQFDRNLEEAQNWGVLGEGQENYVTHLWGKNKDNSAARRLLHEAKTGDFSVNTSMARRRMLESAFEGQLLGLKLKKTDPVALASYNGTEFGRVAAAREFVDRLRSTNVRASDGRPMVVLAGSGKTVVGPDGENVAIFAYPKSTRSIRIADKVVEGLKRNGELERLIERGDIRKSVKEDGKEIYSWDPSDYRTIDSKAMQGWNYIADAPDGTKVLLKADMKVHPEAYQYLNRLLGAEKSLIREVPAFHALQKTAREAKSILLFGDTFHYAQEGLRAIMTGVSPFGVDRWDLRTNPVLAKLVEKGLTLGNDYGSMQAFEEGLVSGPSIILSKIPGIRQWQHYLETFLFEKYLPSLKARASQKLYRRYREQYPEWTDEKVFEVAATDTNERFGGLNYTQMGRKVATQDAFRLLALAPDWLESEVRFIARTFGDEGKVARQDMLKIAGALWITSRVLNYLTTGEGHYEAPFGIVMKDEDGREKLWTMRTLPTDMMHAIQHPAEFVSGRTSPLFRGTVQTYTGRDEWGRKIPPDQIPANFLLQSAPVFTQSAVKEAMGTKPDTSTVEQSAKAFLGASIYPMKTEAGVKAAELASDRSMDGPIDPSAQKLHVLKMKWEDDIRNGKMQPQELFDMVLAGEIAPTDAKSVMRNIKETQGMDPDQARLYLQASRLPAPDFLKVWDIANPDEKAMLATMLIKKRNAYFKRIMTSMTPQQRVSDPTVKRLMRLLSPGEMPF